MRLAYLADCDSSAKDTSIHSIWYQKQFSSKLAKLNDTEQIAYRINEYFIFHITFVLQHTNMRVSIVGPLIFQRSSDQLAN